MKRTKSMTWLLMSAVAAVPLFVLGTTASAQYRVQNNDGRALDANQRLGSGGYNSSNDLPSPVPGNDIVTGNVTGLRRFHGNIDYTDPTAFRGNAPSGRNMDAINRVAGNAPTPDNIAPQFAPHGRVFLGDSRAVAPPSGFRQISPGSSGYIPDQKLQPRSVSDARLGDVTQGSVVDVPRPSQLMMAGPLNQQGEASTITASPLFGIRAATADEQSILTNPNASRDMLGLDEASIQRMRDELRGSANPNQQNNNENNGNKTGNNGDSNQQGTNSNNSNNPNNSSFALNKPLSDQAPSSAVQGQQLSGAALNSNVGQNGEGTRQRFIIPAQEQNANYAEMLRRYNQAEGNQKLTPEQQAQSYNAAMRARQQGMQAGQPGAQPGQPGQPGTGTPGAAKPGTVNQPPNANAPDTKATPGTPGQPGEKKAGPQAKKPEPVQIKSFAEGMKGKGLTEITKQAEDLVRQGKFNSALDKYDAAQQVAPNNPMVKMGRAIAELGAAFYARAESHVRESYGQNPALMVAQFDLRNLLGEDRLQALVKDLRELANKDKKDSRPVFLLAFIAYNTGSANTADGYLDIAEKRAGGNDALLKSLREHWALPEKAAPEQQPAPPAPAAAPAPAARPAAPAPVKPQPNK
jgi:hypothetical protein